MTRLGIFYPEGHADHFELGHPEKPERVEAIKQQLTEHGIWGRTELIAPIIIPEDVFSKIHTRVHIENVKAASEQRGRLDPDTYVTPKTWLLANNSAGGAAAIAKAVWDRKIEKGFALCRPPGHHATPDRAMGFCLFNNIAIAAEYLIQHENAERIFIVDIDLHHGNGTQDIFWNRSDVFFVSIHQYPLYPFSGQLEETGENEGAGYNANLPFPLQSGDNAREAALNEIILPLMESYRPDAVLMSVGFDAHWRDPLGHQLATTSGYVNFIQTISRWTDKFCEGKMGLFLEGGYDIEAGAASALAVCQALAGDDWEDQLGSGEIEESNKWEKVITQAKHVWKLN